MTAQNGLILNEAQVVQKIKRIAFEIYENNFGEKQLLLAGIHGQGYLLAQALAKELSSISHLDVHLAKVDIDKESPAKSEIHIDCEMSKLAKKVVVLVDDVLNTGKTFAYGMKPFLKVEIKKIEIAVLVNRSHPKFPIAPKYTGYELSTTITEHIEVYLDREKAVYLR